MKTCKTCSLSLDESEFYSAKSNIDKLSTSCKKCVSKKNIEHANRNRELSLDKKRQMMQNQDHKCAICGKFIELESLANVDHNHDTGKIRELLCNSCNRVLGSVYENKSTLKSMIEYLEKHEESKEI